MTTPRHSTQTASLRLHQAAPPMLQTVGALVLALLLTLGTLGSINTLAAEQHAATLLARTAALQQAQAITPTTTRS